MLKKHLLKKHLPKKLLPKKLLPKKLLPVKDSNLVMPAPSLLRPIRHITRLTR